MKAELIRKVPPFAVATDLAEIQAGMEVPDVCMSTDETKKGRRNRRHRQQNDQGSGLINCNREGGKTEKQHQRDLVRKNSDEQKTQVKPTDNKPPNLG